MIYTVRQVGEAEDGRDFAAKTAMEACALWAGEYRRCIDVLRKVAVVATRETGEVEHLEVEFLEGVEIVITQFF